MNTLKECLGSGRVLVEVWTKYDITACQDQFHDKARITQIVHLGIFHDYLYYW